MMRIMIVGTAMVIAGAVFAQPAPVTQDVLTNPGAETGDTSPEGWQFGAQIEGVKYFWDRTVARGGKPSLCIEKTAQRYSWVR